MKILKKTMVASAALSLVTLGAVPAFASAQETDSNQTFLQVTETAAPNAEYKVGKTETVDYIVGVRAIINDPALAGKKRIHKIVVTPSWAYGDTTITLSDINLGGQKANVYLADDSKSVKIDNLVDRQKVTFTITRTPKLSDPQATPNNLTNEVRASGEDANGTAVTGETSQSDSTCQANKNFFGDTDACATASIKVKSEAAQAVDAYRANPSKANYDAAVKATEKDPAEKARLAEAKKNIEGATEGLTEFDKSEAAKAVDTYRARPSKANYDAAVKATEKDPAEKARLAEAKKNIESATKGLTEFDKSEAAKAVDEYIKRPYKKDLYEKALKATEKDPAQRARLEAAKKNIEGATKDLHKFLKDDSQNTNDDKPKGRIINLDKTKTGKGGAASTTSNKDTLAHTGAAVGGLAAVAIIAILGGAFALRRRND